METFQRPTIKLGQPQAADVELSEFGNGFPFSPAEMAFLNTPINPRPGGGLLGGGGGGGGNFGFLGGSGRNDEWPISQPRPWWMMGAEYH